MKQRSVAVRDARPIRTAEDAINRGNDFLSGHNYLTSRPVSAKREGEQWEVLFDVSLFIPRQIVRLVIDAESGAITEFSDEGNA